MKKLLYTLLAVSIIFAACKKEDDMPVVVNGCTDATATNYNSNATNNDGSCSYSGCMDSTATNYNPIATEDDGSCTYDGLTGGVWITTKVTEDVAYTVSVAGVVMFDTAYVDIQTDSLEPSSLEFLSSGTVYVYDDGDSDTNTYVKNGNTLTITANDSSFTLDINKLDANNLILVMEQDTAFTEDGMDIVADITQTLEFTRSTIINPTVSQRIGNTNNNWLTKPKFNNILKSIN